MESNIDFLINKISQKKKLVLCLFRYLHFLQKEDESIISNINFDLKITETNLRVIEEKKQIKILETELFSQIKELE